MFIDIRKIEEGTSSAEVNLSFTEELQEAGRLSEEFPAKIDIKRYDGYIFVDVSYEVDTVLECGRCLEEFSKHIVGDVKFILQSSDSEDISSDDVDTYTYEFESDQIDFSQTIYDDIITRFPVQPICSHDCKGYSEYIVETEDEEVVEEHSIDSRWNALKKLKKNK